MDLEGPAMTVLVVVSVFAVIELAIIGLLLRKPTRTFKVHGPTGPEDYWPRGNRR